MSEVQLVPLPQNMELGEEEEKRMEPDYSTTNGSIDEPAALPDASSSDTSGEKPRQIRGITWFLLVLSVISAVFLFSLDTTIVADIQPAMVADLGQIDKLPWISVALAVSATGTCLLW